MARADAARRAPYYLYQVQDCERSPDCCWVQVSRCFDLSGLLIRVYSMASSMVGGQKRKSIGLDYAGDDPW